MNCDLSGPTGRVATVRFPNPLRFRAIAESRQGCWEFEPMNIFQTQSIIRPCGSPEPLAYYKMSMSGSGTLSLPGAEQIQVKLDIWRGHLRFEDGAGKFLFQLRRRHFLSTTHDVEINPGVSQNPELAWMIPFGAYLMVVLEGT